jgi:hypothetical protein
MPIALWLASGTAQADLWAYVDPQGRSHLADHQVDARYKLFFKGETTLDVRNRANAERAQAQAALAGTPLYRNLTDETLARRYAPLIEQYAHANRLDAALVTAIIAVESGFDPNAVSPKGAVGLMQILPATAESDTVSRRTRAKRSPTSCATPARTCGSARAISPTSSPGSTVNCRSRSPPTMPAKPAWRRMTTAFPRSAKRAISSVSCSRPTRWRARRRMRPGPACG